MGRIRDHTGLVAECGVRSGTATASSPKLMGSSQVTCIADDGGDAGAANSHPHLLQPEGARAALGLPPEDQELLLDRDGVHGAVFLPLGIDAAGVSALGLCNLRGEPVRVPRDAAGRAGKSR